MANVPSPKQLEALVILQRIRMAEIMFWVILVLFLGLLGLVLSSLIYGLFDVWLRVGLMLLDGVVGTALLKIVSYLFHRPK